MSPLQSSQYKYQFENEDKQIRHLKIKPEIFVAVNISHITILHCSVV